MPAQATQKSYLDFVIRIVRSGEGVYTAEAQAPSGEASSVFTLPYDEKDLEIFLLRVGRPRQSGRGRIPQAMKQSATFGQQLYHAVVHDEVRDLFVSARRQAELSGSGLRLRLRLSEAPELNDLPWEFLYDGREFLALSDDTPLVRYIDLPNPPRPLSVELPLRILVTVSAPHDQAPIDTGLEITNIREALSRLAVDRRVEVEFSENAMLKTLQGTLRRAQSQGRPFHVWHYIGHGAYDSQQNTSVLILCDQNNLSHPVGGFELGTLFDNYPDTRLALLNACEGARTDREDPFAGVAAALVERGVSAVIGMQFEISDQAAITFSSEFYAALVDGLPLDTACTNARRAVFFLPNYTEWATPVLYLRAPEGLIFEVTPTRPEGQVDLPPRAPVDSDLENRLKDLYDHGLEDFYSNQWGEAAKYFRTIVDLRPDYEQAAEFLERSTRRARLHGLHTKAQSAVEAEDWQVAQDALQALIAEDPEFEGATALLKTVARQKRLHDLYQDALRLTEAAKWQAVLNIFSRIDEIQADYPDPDQLRAGAQDRLASIQQEQQVKDLYHRGLREMESGRWQEARQLLLQVQALAPEHEKVDALLARVQEELSARSQATEEKLAETRRAEELADLYRQARGRQQAEDWQGVLDLLARMAGLDPQYHDPEGLRDMAEARMRPSELEVIPIEAAPAVEPALRPAEIEPEPEKEARPRIGRAAWRTGLFAIAPGAILLILLKILPLLAVPWQSLFYFVLGQPMNFAGLENYIYILQFVGSRGVLPPTAGLIVIRLLVVYGVWRLLAAAWGRGWMVTHRQVLVATAPLPFLFSSGSAVARSFLLSPFTPLARLVSWDRRGWVSFFVMDALNTLAVAVAVGLLVYALAQRGGSQEDPRPRRELLTWFRNLALLIAAASALQSFSAGYIGGFSNFMPAGTILNQLFGSFRFGAAAALATLLLVVLLVLAWLLWKQLHTPSPQLALRLDLEIVPPSKTISSRAFRLLAGLPGVIILLPYLWLLWFILQRYFLNFDFNWGRLFVNSLLLPGLAVGIVQLPVALLCAYALTHLPLPGAATRKALMRLFVLGAVVGEAVVMVPLFTAMRALGWIGTAWASILPLFSSSALVLVLVFVLKSLEPQVDQARSQGLREWVILRGRVLPAVGSVLLLVGTVSIYLASQRLLWLIISAQRPELETFSLAILRQPMSIGETGLDAYTAIPGLVFPLALLFSALLVMAVRRVLRSTALVVEDEMQFP